jgi:hypothetical protein
MKIKKTGINLLKLDLGSGNKPKEGYLGVDIGCKSKNIIKSDVLTYLKKLPKNSVSHIYSRHYLEHVNHENILKLFNEIDRVLIKNGQIIFIVPHFSNPYFYSDPTHKIQFGVHSFSYICQKSCLKRGVPKYIAIQNWELKSVSLNFISMINIKIFGVKIPTLGHILKLLINRSFYLIEVFERYFCYLFSIYEIRFDIVKN